MDSSLAARAFIQLIINAAVAVATRRVLTVVICCDARLRAGSRSSVRALFASLKVAVHRACACVRRSGGQGAGAFLKFCLFFFFHGLGVTAVYAASQCRRGQTRSSHSY